MTREDLILSSERDRNYEGWSDRAREQAMRDQQMMEQAREYGADRLMRAQQVTSTVLPTGDNGFAQMLSRVQDRYGYNDLRKLLEIPEEDKNKGKIDFEF
jgi:hypothetical protein